MVDDDRELLKMLNQILYIEELYSNDCRNGIEAMEKISAN